MLPNNHVCIDAEYQRRECQREKMKERAENTKKDKRDKEALSDEEDKAEKKTGEGGGKWKEMHASLAEKRSLVVI